MPSLFWITSALACQLSLGRDRVCLWTESLYTKNRCSMNPWMEEQMNNRYPARVRIRKPLLLHSLAGRLGTSFFPSLSFSFPICIFLFFIFIFLKIFYLFLERGEGREKERDRNINVWLPLTCHLLGTWPTTQACALTGNQTRDLLVHRSALNPLNHTSRGCFIKKSFINYAITIIPFFFPFIPLCPALLLPPAIPLPV